MELGLQDRDSQLVKVHVLMLFGETVESVNGHINNFDLFFILMCFTMYVSRISIELSNLYFKGLPIKFYKMVRFCP